MHTLNRVQDSLKSTPSTPHMLYQSFLAKTNGPVRKSMSADILNSDGGCLPLDWHTVLNTDPVKTSIDKHISS